MTSMKNVAAAAYPLVIASGGLAATSAQAETAHREPFQGRPLGRTERQSGQEAVAKFLLDGRALRWQ